MFEGSLMESRGLVVSRAQRWSAVGSAAFQMMLAVMVVVIPLLRPQTMKIITAIPHLTAPPVPVKPPQRMRIVTTNETPSGISALQNAPQAAATIQHFPLNPDGPIAEGPPQPIGTIMTGSADPMAELAHTPGGVAVTVARAASPGRINVSRGVSEGMLLAPIRPVYPQIAIATKTQGAVIVEAVISKAGRIESEHVVSGPPMLRQAALDAISAAHYRPYLLSGEPVEVQTTITVMFKLGE